MSKRIAGLMIVTWDVKNLDQRKHELVFNTDIRPGKFDAKFVSSLTDGTKIIVNYIITPSE